MKIAFIDPSLKQNEFIKEILSTKQHWNIEYFTNPLDFSEKDPKIYDIIITEESLQDITGHELIKLISKRTDAEFAIIGENLQDFFSESLFDESISAIIEKNEHEEIISWIQYLESKIRIKKIFEKEQNNYVELISQANGYTISDACNYAIIEYSKLLTFESKEILFKQLKQFDYNCILIIDKSTTITSLHLGQILTILNFIKIHKGNFVVVCEDKKIFDLTALSEIIPIVHNIEQACKLINEKLVEKSFK
jgi:hypothetical protein